MVLGTSSGQRAQYRAVGTQEGAGADHQAGCQGLKGRGCREQAHPSQPHSLGGGGHGESGKGAHFFQWGCRAGGLGTYRGGDSLQPWEV